MSNTEFEATYEVACSDYDTLITFIDGSFADQKYQCTECSAIVAKGRCLNGIHSLTCPYCEGDVVKFE